MKHKRLLTSLIVGLALLLGLLIMLNLTATAAPPSTVVNASTLDPDSEPDAPIDAPSSGARENGFDDLPPGLAPALARAMANDLPESYHVQAGASGYQAENAAHSLATTFDAAGPLVEIAGETWGLSLTGWGREGEIAPVLVVAPVANGPRLEYHRGPLTEWYLNTTWGLEQGFTLSSPPKRGEGKLVLEMTTRGSLRAKQDGATGLLLTDAEGQTVARYTGLHVYDAAGRDLPARLTLRNAQLAIFVDDADAVYPITVDPWIQSAKLTANDGEEYDYFGQAVAIDGDTVVVGAPSGGMFPTPGAVYVFRKQGTSWNSTTQIAKLTANDGAPGDNFGGAVAIDGDTVVAGAYGDDGYRGAVYVFVEPKSGWGWYDIARTAKLTAAGGTADDYLGGAVAIEGDTIVAGAYGDDGYRGAVYVFSQPTGGWRDITHTARLTAADGLADDGLGTSVAIAGDTIVAGAKGDDGYRGAAYVFSQPTGGWRDITHTAKLTANDGAAYDYLGGAVAIDGDTILVGAYGDDVGGNDNQGAAYVFVEPAAGWQDTTHTAKLKAADGAPWDNFGRSVSIEGDAIVAGAYGDDVGGGSDVGAAYVFVKPTGGWRDITHTLKLTATDGAPWDHLGRSVAIDGMTIVAGATGDDSNQGAAYVFAQPLLLSKSVTPTIDVPRHSALTYTLVLQNIGPANEPNILVTDTLSAQPVAFARWVVSPTGTLRDGGMITWTGTVPAGNTLTWMWVVTHTGRYGDVVTNTAGFSGPLQAGADDVTFIVEEPPVLYVDADAAGPMHDGLSWTTAYTNVQDALDHTHAYGAHDYEIWVAEGVYYPDEGAGHTADSESESFTLSYDNVQLYGGFAATETLRTERDWMAHVTILSGDIDGNDANTDGNHIAETWHVITGSNADHVLWLDGVTNEDITADTVIDGFTITAGQADSSLEARHRNGGGLYCDGESNDPGADNGACSPMLVNVTFSGNDADENGGGMYNNGRFDGVSSPALTNVTFSGNDAHNSGGGMYNDGFSSGESSPTLSDVAFSGNKADDGGGMYNDGRDSGVSSPALTDVTFSGNRAGYDGGGMYNDGSGDSGVSSPVLTAVAFRGNRAGYNGGGMVNFGVSSPALKNVVFSGNKAGYGGGMFNSGYGVSSPALTNVTFSGNRAGAGGGMYNELCNPELTNVIIWGNEATSGNQLFNVAATPFLRYTLIANDHYNDIYNRDNGSVTYGNGILTDDPHFVAPVPASAAPTIEGDYRLKCTSPAVDAGHNTPPGLSGITTDLDGNDRFTDMPRADTGHGTPPIVDMGAYEASPPLGMRKTVTPMYDVAYHGTLTYTVILSNTGIVSDTNLLFTDSLSSQPVSFATWIVSPTGTVLADDGAAGSVITWTGTLTPGHALTWTWTVVHTGDYGDLVTNTAAFSGALQAGADAVAFAIEEPDVLYVDADADPDGNGQFWDSAYQYLQDALDYTNAHGDHDYEIWVAQGIYTPAVGTGHTAISESKSFTISYNNVQLYGGFASGESSRDQRDWEANVTILSGDIDGDDIDIDDNSIAEIADNINGDNADHVLWLDGVTHEPITETTVIDGFIITAGQADNDYPNERGGGLYCDGAGSGHGADHGVCSPTLTNVIFSGNHADNRGGGMYNDGRDGGESSPALINVAFSGNEAFDEDGGGMYNDGRHDGRSSPTLINVLFEDNRGDEGGGIYNTGRDGGVSSPALTNVTISGNDADKDDGGGMYNDGRGGASSPTLVNVIIWGNEAVDAGQQLYNEYATPVFSYTLIQTGTAHIHNDEGSSASYVHVLTDDPQFVAPTAGNYRLQASSPAIDAGDNTAPGLGGVTTDLDGHARFANTPQADTGNGETPIVDMGAYERLPPLRLRKTAWPTQDVGRHDTVTYTLTLANAGTHSDTILLTDTLPISTSFVTWVVSPTGTLRTGHVITWSGALTAGHTLTWTWTVTHSGDYGDVIANTATFSSTHQTDEAEATFTVEPELPKLTLSKIVMPTIDVSYHSVTTYTAVLSNTSGSDDTNARFDDTLPDEVDFARWVVSPPNTALAPANKEITWSGTVTAGHALTWTWVVTHTGAYGDVITNTAEFSGTHQTGKAEATFTVEPSLADVEIDKAVAPMSAAPGDPMTYTLTFANTGNVTATNVVITDHVPVSVTQTNVISTSNFTIRPRSGVRYVWDVGDLVPDTGGSITINGVLSDSLEADSEFVNTAIIAATADSDFDNNSSSVSVAVLGVTSSTIYLPLVMRNYVEAPDLVVEELVAAPNQIQVVIENVGDMPVENEFWVDVYIDPTTPPMRVNQMWQNVGDQGLVWGVTQGALPMVPGDVLTLTMGDALYWPSESNVNWPLAEDITVYAQVDSAGHPAYGGVLEGHEIIGGDYNNIAETTVSTDTAAYRLDYRVLELRTPQALDNLALE